MKPTYDQKQTFCLPQGTTLNKCLATCLSGGCSLHPALSLICQVQDQPLRLTGIITYPVSHQHCLVSTGIPRYSCWQGRLVIAVVQSVSCPGSAQWGLLLLGRTCHCWKRKQRIPMFNYGIIYFQWTDGRSYNALAVIFRGDENI